MWTLVEWTRRECVGAPGRKISTTCIHGLALDRRANDNLLTHTTPAWARLGDPKASEFLTRLLAENPDDLVTCNAVALSLGMLGDPAAIDSLVKILGNDGASLVNRTYAAIALGGIVDDELPFHWKIADNLNYRSVVTTLVYRGTGILEIL